MLRHSDRNLARRKEGGMSATAGLNHIWTLIALVAAGVFVVRFSFFVIMDRIAITAGLRRVLTFIPAAVLPTIIVPSVVFKGSTPGLDPANLRLYAAAIAVYVAWNTKNLFATIGAGMAALWVLKWLCT